MALASLKAVAKISKKIGSSAKKHKKGLIFGGIGGGLIAIIFASIIALIPLKMEHMIKNSME